MGNEATTIIRDINRSAVVSFDVFDTLITRRFIRPRDVLFYTGVMAARKLGLKCRPWEFMRLRMACEKEARENSDREDIRLDDVYELFGERLFVGKETAEVIKSMELDSERLFSVVRPALKEVYDYAAARGKKIYFVSDMYLPRDFIIELLRRQGYDATPENTLVSSEEGVLKHTGNLFRRLLELAAPEDPADVLHIGDNFAADVATPRSLGMRGFWCQNPHEILMSAPAVAKLFRPNADGAFPLMGINLCLGLVANRLCEAIHPAKVFNTSTLFSGSAYNLGYFGLGILLQNFTDWLKDRLLEEGAEQAVFLARDGQLLKDVYDIVYGNDPAMPPSVYLYSSRRMFSLPPMRGETDLNEIFSRVFRGSAAEFVRERLGLADPGEFAEAEAVLREKLGLDPGEYIDTNDQNRPLGRRIAGALKEQILRHAAKEREAILRYFAETLDTSKKTAMVDLGYNGSAVCLYNELTGADAVSLNLVRDAAARERCAYPFNQKVLAYLQDEIPFVEYNYDWSQIIPMLETCFSTKDNQAEKVVIKDGRCEIAFIADAESRNPRRLQFVDDVRAGVTDFVRDFTEARKSAPELFVSNAVDASKALSLHFNEPILKDLEIWDGIYFENNFSGWKNKTIFSTSKKFFSLWAANAKADRGEPPRPVPETAAPAPGEPRVLRRADEPGGAEIVAYPGDGKNVLITLAAAAPGDAGPEGFSARGCGLVARALGCDGIAVTAPDPGFFAGPFPADLAELVGKNVPEEARVLCAGEGAGARGAVELALALGCPFLAFAPDPDELPEETAARWREAAASRDPDSSLLIYAPGAPGAAGLAAILNCGTARIPYGIPAPAGRAAGARELARLFGEFFAEGTLPAAEPARPEAAPRPAVRVALCLPPDAAGTADLGRLLAARGPENLAIREFDPGEAGPAGVLVTCAERDIPDEYDLCVAAAPEGPAPGDRFPTEHSRLGILRALLALFAGKRCRLILLLPARPDPFGPLRAILPRLAGRAIPLEGADRDDPAGAERLAKRLALLLADPAPLSDFKPAGSREPRFALLSRIPRYKDKFAPGEKGADGWLLNPADAISLNRSDLGFGRFAGPCCVAAIRYRSTANANSLYCRTDGADDSSFHLKRRDSDRDAVMYVSRTFKKKVSFRLTGRGGKLIRVPGAAVPAVSPAHSELLLKDILFADRDLETLGAETAAEWGVPTPVRRFAELRETYARTGDFRCFDLFENPRLAAAFLKLMPEGPERAEFLEYCLENTGSARSEILELTGDLDRAENRPELARLAYLEALKYLSADPDGLFYKLSELCIFELRDFAAAREILNRLDRVSAGNVREDRRFCRHSFLVNRRFGNNPEALHFGRKMCEKQPDNAKWRADYEAFRKSLGLPPAGKAG